MANEAGLKIVIDAEIAQAVNGFNKVADAAEKAGKDIKSAISTSGTGFEKIQKQTDKTAKALTDLKTPANAASLTLTDLGRIANDLPFGLTGIANNLAPLGEGFGRLTKQAGGVGPALLAIGKSLIGPAGILFAIQAIPAAFIILQNGIAGFNRKSKDARDEADKLADTIKGVAKAANEVKFTAFASIAGDIAKVEALSRAVQDETRSQTERKRALEDLQQVNKSYFGDLTLQDATLGRLTKKVNDYTDALLKEAIIKELSGEIGKLGAAYVKQQEQVGKAEKSLRDYEDQLTQTRNKISKGDPNAFVLLDPKDEVNLQSLKNNLKDQQNILLPLAAQYNSLKTSIEDYTDATLKTKSLKTPTAASGKTAEDIAKEKIADLNDELQSYQKQLAITNKLREAGLITAAKENDALDLQIKIFDKLDEIDRTEVALRLKPKLEIDPRLSALELQKAITEYTKRVAATPIGTQFGEVNTSLVLNADNLIPADAFDKAIARMREGGQRLKEAIILSGQEIKGATGSVFADIGAAVEDGAASAAVSVGESIADVLSGLDSGGGILRSFGRVLGGVITQIGKMLITAAIAVSGLKKAVNALVATPAGPGIALAAGLAAIVIGKTLENSFSNVKPRPFATGGLVNSPTLGLVGEAGPEVVLPLDRLPGLLKDTGNAGNVNIVGELRADARGIYANFKRWENSANRMGG